MKIHVASREEYPAVLKLVEEGTEHGRLTKGYPKDLSRLEAALDSCVVLLATQPPDATPLGTLIFAILPHIHSGCVTSAVITWYVRDGFRGLHIGYELLRQYIEFAKIREVNVITLSMDSGENIESTERLIRKAGFEYLGGQWALAKS